MQSRAFVPPECQTPAKDGTVMINQQREGEVSRKSGRSKGLLLNHPLDCPVCDKAGELHVAGLHVQIRQSH